MSCLCVRIHDMQKMDNHIIRSSIFKSDLNNITSVMLPAFFSSLF